jgi:acylphosphatase
LETGINIIVKGIVQGVGFRYFVYNNAVNLGLKGYVKNLYDGAVEIDVEGDRSLIEELIKEVKVGPRFAHITNMITNWQEANKHYKNFEVL